MPTTALRRLAELELFTDCRRADLAMIDRLGVTLDLPPGRTLCQQGARGAEFFVVLAGLVDVRSDSGTEALLHPGAWFGELALLDDSPRRATVVTRTAVTVLVFGRREFRRLLTVAPGVRARLERTRTRILDGMVPTRRPWYQQLSPAFPAMSSEGS